MTTRKPSQHALTLFTLLSTCLAGLSVAHGYTATCAATPHATSVCVVTSQRTQAGAAVYDDPVTWPGWDFLAAVDGLDDNASCRARIQYRDGSFVVTQPTTALQTSAFPVSAPNGSFADRSRTPWLLEISCL